MSLIQTGHNNGPKNPMFGKHHTKETKRKISEINKGLKRSKEAKEKMSIIHKGPKNHNWKGGHLKSTDGRIMILIPKHPFSQKNGYIRRSRLVMEKKLRRYLTPEEVVHHINGIVDDDKPENLQLFLNVGSHTKFHHKMKL